MSNAVAVAALSAQTFPLTVVAGPVLFELLDASGAAVASQAVGSTAADLSATVTFSNIAPGTYTVRATRVDTSSTPLAAAVVSAPFTVAATTTTITIPTSVDVAVS